MPFHDKELEKFGLVTKSLGYFYGNIKRSNPR